jgi:cation diffusion facilitator CzcD-associated flavoprotein CzcO
MPGQELRDPRGARAIGGTWDLFRFPGIRSDSDMFTLCYPFRPWRGSRAIADGPRSSTTSARPLASTASTTRSASTPRRRGRVVLGGRALDRRGLNGRGERLTCGFLFTCTGYYRYDEGYTPQFAGIERFGGEIVAPAVLDRGRRRRRQARVVIGSGATA